jgi:hypothetical protein
LKQKIRSNNLHAFIISMFIIIECSASIGFSSGLLDDYFYPPEHSARMVMVTCREMVPDNSPGWGHILLAGFIYALSESEGEEMIAVAIREQDYIARIYSVRRNDFVDYMDEKITLQSFVRKMYMAKVR